MRRERPSSLVSSGIAGLLCLVVLDAGSMAGAAPAPSSALHASGPKPSDSAAPRVATGECYSQLPTDTGDMAVSQNFADDTLYDSQAADDFTLTRTCRMTGVDVEGAYFSGYGPAASVAVTVYRDAGRKPGAVVAGGNEPSNRYSDPGDVGNLDVKLHKGLTLSPGHYWVSVVVNMAYNAGGEWGWLETYTKTGRPAVWENPPGEFGLGCKTYTDIRRCLGIDAGTDMEFAIEGMSK
jgi:hypothetical protein